MSKLSRRNVLKSVLTGATLASLPSASWSQENAPIKRKGNIRQSVSRWCYQKIPLDKLCAFAAEIGLKAVDLLNPDEFEIPARYGLVCSMGYGGGGEIASAMNRPENHTKIEEGFRKYIPLAAKASVPNVITFSGNRNGMSDEEGARNTIAGLNRVKLLFDIYHMQIMEGDLVRTIQKNIDWIAHFHTGGVPGRHELDATQEVQWDGVMRGIAATNFRGYVAHEFVPTRDPLVSLRQAADLCDV